MNIQIFRTGNTHELRHVFVRNGHLYPGTKPGSKRVNPIKRLHTVRIQDIQAQPDFIDPITKVGADTIIDEYKIAVDEILANV
jgi:cation diffusion facilitator CzcD-associated flavoprotein CzcO